MPLIKLTGGFTPIPEGTHVFKITKVDYKETFGKLEIHMETAEGKKHVERFSFLKSDGSTNDKAFSAFSFFARTILNDNTAEEIDPEDLVGHYFRATVEHDVQPSKKKEGETVTWVKLTDKEPADGFDDGDVPEEEEEEEAPAPAPAAPKKKYDLKALLG